MALLCALHDADKLEGIETVVLTVSDDLLGFEWELELCRELWLWEFSWGDILVPKRRKILPVIIWQTSLSSSLKLVEDNANLRVITTSGWITHLETFYYDLSNSKALPFPLTAKSSIYINDSYRTWAFYGWMMQRHKLLGLPINSCFFDSLESFQLELHQLVYTDKKYKLSKTHLASVHVAWFQC